MESKLKTVKDELHHIIDEMPDDMPVSELITAKRFLEYLRQRWQAQRGSQYMSVNREDLHRLIDSNE